MLPPKNRPRHLPTLTHVVTSSEIAVAGYRLSEPQAEQNSNDSEQRVQQIIQELMPQLSVRIRELLQELMDERLHLLEANLQQELPSMVRRAINVCEVPTDT